MGKLGLEKNRYDAWATHALAHTYEEQARHNHLLTVMKDTEKNWSISEFLAGHNYWHMSLCHVEKGDLAAALDVYDRELNRRVMGGNSALTIMDASSLLFRLEQEGVDVGGRWKEMMSVIEPRLDDHVSAFHDGHYMLVCAGSKDMEARNRVLNSLDEFVRCSRGDTGATSRQVAQQFGVPLCRSIAMFADQQYDDVVSLLAPLRYKLVNIGGSNPQRDVFQQLLLHACLRSKEPYNQNLGRSLMWERKAAKESPLTERLIARHLAVHEQGDHH
jgi:hypothetical protein